MFTLLCIYWLRLALLWASTAGPGLRQRRGWTPEEQLGQSADCTAAAASAARGLQLRPAAGERRSHLRRAGREAAVRTGGGGGTSGGGGVLPVGAVGGRRVGAERGRTKRRCLGYYSPHLLSSSSLESTTSTADRPTNTPAPHVQSSLHYLSLHCLKL